MTTPGHSIACPHCEGTQFREEKIVELDATVMVTKGMKMAAQAKMVRYQYTCITCQNVLDEQFEKGHLSIR